MAWLRFILTAFFLALAIFSFATAVLGNVRFGFVMNRIHAAGIGDTLGLLSAMIAVMLGTGEWAIILKLILITAFLWLTSPVSTHFLGQIEYYMDPTLEEHADREELHEHS